VGRPLSHPLYGAGWAVDKVDATFVVCFPDGSSATYLKDELDADFTTDDAEAPTRPWVRANCPQASDHLARIKAAFGADGKPLQPAQPLPHIFHKYRGHGIVEELPPSRSYLQWLDKLSLMLTFYRGPNDLAQFALYRYNIRFPRVPKSCGCHCLTMDHFSPASDSDMVYEIRLCEHPLEAPFNGRHAKFVEAHPDENEPKVSIIILEQDDDNKHAKDAEGRDIVLKLSPDNLAEATATCFHNFVEMKLSDILTDAWFDSKPDDKPDDEYIKWRNRPSSCTPATADAESALPSGEPARPMVVFDSDAELQLSMPKELSDAVTQIEFLVV